MATLEKIRRKSVLLLIVIAVALLAFIVGDALTNSRNIFGNASTVAKVGGIKIDITEYQQKLSELNNQLEMQRRNNPGAVQDIDQQVLAQMAIDQLVQDKLMEQAVNKLGIKVTSDQLRYFMIENPQNQNVSALIYQMNQSGIGVRTPQEAYQAIFQPQSIGRAEAEMKPFRDQWIALENETRDMVAQYTYSQLLYRTIQANDLDKQLLAADYAIRVSTNYAYKEYGDLDPKKYPVSEAELKAAYNENKYMYKVDDVTKTIGVICVNVAPSAADINESRTLASGVAASLRKPGGTLSKEQKKTGVNYEKHSLRAADIANASIKDFVAAAPKDSLLFVTNDITGFQIIRMGNREETVDSIQIDLVQAVGQKLPKRVLASLNSGLSIDSVTKVFSADSTAVTKEQWIPLYTAQGKNEGIPQAYLDSLYKSEGAYVMLESSDQGAVIGRLVKKNAPVNVYNYEEYTYRLKPGQNTMADANQKLTNFLAANPNASKFMANAAKAGFNVSTVDVSQSTPALPEYDGMASYLPDSRQVMRWVMIDGEEGDVSRIYESSDPYAPKLYAVAIIDEFDEYLPINHRRVSKELTEKVRNDKAGDQLIAQYGNKGQSVAQISRALGVTPKTTDTHFNPFNRGGINDNDVVGAIVGTKPGSKARMVKGKNGVYVFEVVSVGKDNVPYDEQMILQQYQGFINPDLVKMLLGKQKVKNNIYKFEAGK